MLLALKLLQQQVSEAKSKLDSGNAAANAAEGIPEQEVVNAISASSLEHLKE